MSDEGNFWRKVLVGCTVGAFLALLTFFGWLGSMLLDVRDRTTRIEEKVTSLLQTRVVAEEQDAAQIERRIDDLERSER